MEDYNGVHELLRRLLEVLCCSGTRLDQGSILPGGPAQLIRLIGPGNIVPYRHTDWRHRGDGLLQSRADQVQHDGLPLAQNICSNRRFRRKFSLNPLSTAKSRPILPMICVLAATKVLPPKEIFS